MQGNQAYVIPPQAPKDFDTLHVEYLTKPDHLGRRRFMLYWLVEGPIPGHPACKDPATAPKIMYRGQVFFCNPAEHFRKMSQYDPIPRTRPNEKHILEVDETGTVLGPVNF